MQIQFFCPRWGSEHIGWDIWLKQVRDAGYDGVEWGIANHISSAELDKVFNLLAKENMPVIVQHFDTNNSDFNRHLEVYRNWLEKIKKYPFVKFNSQTGKDYFELVNNIRLIQTAREILRNALIVHETHRGKFSFAAHITSEYLRYDPYLRLTLDASHWVNVAESLLEDQQDVMGLAIQRTDHIHARIGYPEGPQITDPRAEIWKDAFDRHLEWWDEVVRLKSAQKEVLTITPEFGPFPYMIHDPVFNKPIVNQWEVNIFMMQFLKGRYKQF